MFIFPYQIGIIPLIYSLYPTFLVFVIILKYTLSLTILQAHDIMSFTQNKLFIDVC